MMSGLPKKTVVVGMSGGVDSSVSAYLLKQQGYHVIGLFMKNWEEQDENGVCKASAEFEDVVRVCDHLNIPYYSVSFAGQYWDNVFQHFLSEYQAGLTPNPDILCNREIKFKALLDKAIELGADYLATGHYCQIEAFDHERRLLKGNDPGKDQSYFLYTVKSQALKNVLFPVGSFPKKTVRTIAKEAGLATSEKKDSTGICFIGKRDFKEFLGSHIGYTPGEFHDLSGKLVGRHDGAAFYTIGQRKGMGIGGAGEAWFVAGKDVTKNIVYVAQGAQHPSLFCDELTATELTWISPKGAPPLPFACKSKVRYRQPDQECVIERIEGDRIYVRFPVPQRAVTPRQSIVFYQGNICLGGAMIETPGPSYHIRGLPLPEVTSP